MSELSPRDWDIPCSPSTPSFIGLSRGTSARVMMSRVPTQSRGGGPAQQVSRVGEGHQLQAADAGQEASDHS